MAESEVPAVLVTGSSRGLGRGVALELAAAGMSVAIHCRANREAAERTAEDCRAAAPREGQHFPVIAADLAAEEGRRGLIARTVEALGRLDALVNNAGIASPGRVDIVEATEDSWDQVMDTNLKAPYFLARTAAAHWLRNPAPPALPGGPKLVFVSSVSSELASTNRGDYCISKAGLSMAARLWALRLAPHGIQVIEFRPGIMETDMTAAVKAKYDPLIESGQVPQRRWGRPEDLGLAVRAFLTGAFPFTTGDSIYLDGGLHLPRL